MDQEDMIKNIEEETSQPSAQQPQQYPSAQYAPQPQQYTPVQQPKKKISIMQVLTTISYIILAIATLFIAVGLWMGR